VEEESNPLEEEKDDHRYSGLMGSEISTLKVLEFQVIDSGLGIKEENMSQLFKLFGKVSEQSNVNKQGIGLGLTICKKLTELLGGKISVDSVFNQGTTFTFTIKCETKPPAFLSR